MQQALPSFNNSASLCQHPRSLYSSVSDSAVTFQTIELLLLNCTMLVMVHYQSMGQCLNFGCMLAAKSPREHRSSCHHGLQGHSDHILECFHSIHPQCGHSWLQGAQLSLAMQPFYPSCCQLLLSRTAAVLPALQPTTQMLFDMNADFTSCREVQSLQLIYHIHIADQYLLTHQSYTVGASM